jgi:pimeloyl-ACP methyl ester carboxylesterase
MAPQFAGVLFGPGALLDTTRYYIILPDGIGHGRSSKPSDGLRMRFPRYDYDDMVIADHRLLTEHLGVSHLRLVMGTSMGGMHSWVWGEMFPDFMDALMPLACQPVAIVGRNRLWRDMAMDAIRNDRSGRAATTPARRGRVAHRDRSAADRRQRSDLPAELAQHARHGGPLPGQPARHAHGEHRRQRPPLPGGRVAHV